MSILIAFVLKYLTENGDMENHITPRHSMVVESVNWVYIHETVGNYDW
jgi:hypothetical protein